MSIMFKEASSFNQNLCAWKDNFPYSNANEIFADSGCAYTSNPSSVTKGPFCASDCTNPSPNPSYQPSSSPIFAPTSSPSAFPSSNPSYLPSSNSKPSTVTSNPSSLPTYDPNSQPSPKPSTATLSNPSSVPTNKECLLSKDKDVIGRQFVKETSIYDFDINVCEGDINSNCGIYQEEKENVLQRTFYLGSFTKFVDETDTSITAIFQNGNYCSNHKPRNATVTFIMSDCKDCICDAYDIAFTEPAHCVYEFTVTLTDA